MAGMMIPWKDIPWESHSIVAKGSKPWPVVFCALFRWGLGLEMSYPPPQPRDSWATLQGAGLGSPRGHSAQLPIPESGPQRGTASWATLLIPCWIRSRVPRTWMVLGGRVGGRMEGAATTTFLFPHIRGPTCGSDLPLTSFSFLHFPR